jgi:hypothetical protein
VRPRRAISIVESLMASTVLAIAVVGIAGPIGAAGEQAELVRERGTALVLARQLLEEIASKPLCDGGTTCHLGPERSSGESERSKFDSGDDYHQYHDTTADLYNLSGQRIGYDAGAVYTRDVNVEYRATIAGAAAASGDFAVVTVTVTTPHRQAIKVYRLLCKQSQTL